MTAVKGTSTLGGLKSVTLLVHRKEIILPENELVTPDNGRIPQRAILRAGARRGVLGATAVHAALVLPGIVTEINVSSHR